jgi:hypothetical protein
LSASVAIPNLAENGYQSSIVDKLIKKQKNKKDDAHNTSLSAGIKLKYVPIEYNDKINYSLQRELKPHGIVLAYRTSNKLGKLVNQSNKEKSLCQHLPACIKCSDCPKFDVGQTGRNFETRFKEHLLKRSTIANRSQLLPNI